MDFQVPELGEGMYEAELVAWLVKVGDPVARGQNLIEVMTDKATMEVRAPFAGTIRALQAEPGETIKVGQVVLSYTPADGDGAEAAKVPAPRREQPAASRPATAAVGVAERTVRAAPPSGHSTPSAAPSVRLLARKLGIDLAQIHGSGPHGRILVDDLTHVIQQTGAAKAPVAEPHADYGTPGQRIKLIGLRRRIAEHMIESKRTIPHYGYVDECDLSELVRVRNSLRETFTKAGSKLTYLAFMVKAAVGALKEVPIVNASLDEKAGEIVLHDRYHMGVAVATPAGLIVPVIHDADKLSLLQIAREIERLGHEARSGKARREDLLDGTFTITSIGSIGGLISTPIVNHPQVGIMGVGKVVKRPVYDEAGNLHPADLVYLSFSFDHRVLDGAVGAAFGNAMIRRLQNPAALLLPEPLQ